jgi:hypothetical protein
MLHIVKAEKAGGVQTYAWKDCATHWVMRRGLWTYKVRKAADGWHYAALHFLDRSYAHSEDRRPSKVEAMDFCHQHADQRLGWSNAEKALELRFYSPSSLADRLANAGVAQGLAEVRGDEIRWKPGCDASQVDLDGEGVDLG